MNSLFYKSVIDDEIEVFGIKKESLKNAAISVGMTYSRKALTQGQTFLDYNVPSHRCAYLYKYASIHTDLVSKYFSKLLKKKIIKSSLNAKESLKICCLGGGPGTDIVGLFKVLALYPQYYNKVVEVTILDICGGWRNSFKRVISNLMDGKVKGVPDNFVSAENFKFKLVEVNLLSSLPANVVTILSEADIVCMVKFVSAILGSSSAVSALQVIGEKMKVGAVVLFIDNFQGNVFKTLSDISGKVGLALVMEPLHESFNKKTGYKKGSVTSAEKQLFGCVPLHNTRVTVLGFIKNISVSNNNDVPLNNVSFANTLDDDDDSSWNTDDETEVCVKQNPKRLIESATNTKSAKCSRTKHKFTQTSEKCSSCRKKESHQTESIPVHMLSSLVEKLCELTNILSIFQQRFFTRKCNCH